MGRPWPPRAGALPGAVSWAGGPSYRRPGRAQAGVSISGLAGLLEDLALAARSRPAPRPRRAGTSGPPPSPWSWRETSPPVASIRKKWTVFFTRSPPTRTSRRSRSSELQQPREMPVSSCDLAEGRLLGRLALLDLALGQPPHELARPGFAARRGRVSQASPAGRTTTPPAEVANRVFTAPATAGRWSRSMARTRSAPRIFSTDDASPPGKYRTSAAARGSSMTGPDLGGQAHRRQGLGQVAGQLAGARGPDLPDPGRGRRRPPRGPDRACGRRTVTAATTRPSPSNRMTRPTCFGIEARRRRRSGRACASGPGWGPARGARRARPARCGRPRSCAWNGESSGRVRNQSGRGRVPWPWRGLLRSALAADRLVELDAVALLGGVATLLAADAADALEELRSVALLGGETALSAGLGADSSCSGTGHGCVLPGRGSVGIEASRRLDTPAPTAGKQSKIVQSRSWRTTRLAARLSDAMKTEDAPAVTAPPPGASAARAPPPATDPVAAPADRGRPGRLARCLPLPLADLPPPIRHVGRRGPPRSPRARRSSWPQARRASVPGRATSSTSRAWCSRPAATPGPHGERRRPSRSGSSADGDVLSLRHGKDRTEGSVRQHHPSPGWQGCQPPGEPGHGARRAGHHPGQGVRQGRVLGVPSHRAVHRAPGGCAHLRRRPSPTYTPADPGHPEAGCDVKATFFVVGTHGRALPRVCSAA